MYNSGRSVQSENSYPNNVKINYSTNQSVYSNPPENYIPKEFNVDVRVKVNMETGRVLLTIPQKQQSVSRVVFNMPQNPDFQYAPQPNFNQPLQVSSKYISYPNQIYPGSKQPSIASLSSQSSRQPSLPQNNIIYSNPPKTIPIQIAKNPPNYQPLIHCQNCSMNYRQSQFNQHLSIHHRNQPYQQKMINQNVYIMQEPPMNQINQANFRKIKAKPQPIDNLVQNKPKESLDQSPKFNDTQVKQYNFDRVSASQRNKMERQKFQKQRLLKESRASRNSNEILSNRNMSRNEQIQNQSVRHNDSFFQNNDSFNLDQEPKFYQETNQQNNNSFRFLPNQPQNINYQNSKPSSKKSLPFQYQEDQNVHNQSIRLNSKTNNSRNYEEQNVYNLQSKHNSKQSSQKHIDEQIVNQSFRFNSKQSAPKNYQQEKPNDSFRFNSKQSIPKNYQQQNLQDSFRFNQRQSQQAYQSQNQQDSFRFNNQKQSSKPNQHDSFRLNEKQPPQIYNQQNSQHIQYQQQQDSFRLNEKQPPQLYNQQNSQHIQYQSHQDSFRLNEKQPPQLYNQQNSQHIQYQSHQDSFRLIQKPPQQYYQQNSQDSFRISEKQFKKQYQQQQDSFRFNQKQGSQQYQQNSRQQFRLNEKQPPQYYQNPHDSFRLNQKQIPQQQEYYYQEQNSRDQFKFNTKKSIKKQYEEKNYEDERRSVQREQFQDRFSDVESKRSYKTTPFRYEDREQLEDPMFRSNKNELEYNYDRLRRPYQIIQEKSELVSQASSQGKKKIPKNLLAVEMAISQRKQKQLQAKRQKQRYYK